MTPSEPAGDHTFLRRAYLDVIGRLPTPAETRAFLGDREPDKRPQFIEFAKRWQSMPPAQRERARHGMQRWEGMSPEQREQARALFHGTRDMDKDARRAFFGKWRQMTPQQRTDWLKAHPAPEHDSARD